MNARIRKKIVQIVSGFGRFRRYTTEAQMSKTDWNDQNKTRDEEIAELFENHQQMMLLTAKVHAGNHVDAEDVVQNIFLRLLQNGISDELRLNPGGYLHQAAVNEARSLHRLRKRQRVDSSVDILKLTTCERSTDYDLVLSVRKAKAALTDEEAAIVDLYYTHGYTHEEIAGMKGKTEDAVAKSLSRSREKMLAFMGYYEAEEKRRGR